MSGLDASTALGVALALFLLFFILDFLFAGGGMTGAMMGGMMHGTAAMLGSPYGWALLLALVVIILAVFGFVFR